MFALVFCGLLVAITLVLSLLLGDAVIHARLDEESRRRRRARVFRLPPLVRPVERRRQPAHAVAVERRHAA